MKIDVEPHPYPVNYRGQYHYRSGSTKQELKGAALDKFLPQKQGLKWDGCTVLKVTINDLSQKTLSFFRDKASKSLRINSEIINDSDIHLLENLHLLDSNLLKRAAILLFHPDPEKIVTGAFIKIGFFDNEHNIRFQDEIHGNLFEQIERTIELLSTKYIGSELQYDGIQRVEALQYPLGALREIVLNAIAHKDYSGSSPIQIRVYKDKIMFWNEGQLPESWSVETLIARHASRPFNPDIANALFRSGYIESWGRGISKIISECNLAKIPNPVFSSSDGGVSVELSSDIYNDQFLSTLNVNHRQLLAIYFIKESGKITNKDYQLINKCSRNTASRDLNELVIKQVLRSNGRKGAGTFYRLKQF